MDVLGLTKITYKVVQKTDTQFYFWDDLGNSAPILTIIIINLFAIFSYQIADIYHAMAGHQKNTKFN